MKPDRLILHSIVIRYHGRAVSRISGGAPDENVIKVKATGLEQAIIIDHWRTSCTN